MKERWRALSIELESLIGYDAASVVLCRITRGRTTPTSNLKSLEKLLEILR